jgi:hypothetical protein
MVAQKSAKFTNKPISKIMLSFADKNEYPAFLNFYEARNCRATIDEVDCVAIAFDERIIGAMRLCSENGINVLRSMQVEPAWQQKGIRLSMLKFLVSYLNMMAVNACLINI